MTREVPADPYGYLLQDPHGRRIVRIPETELQALMEAAPNHEPLRSKEEHERESAATTSAVDAALALLTPLQRYVVQATVIERRSFRQVGRDVGLSKSSIHRIREQAFGELREQLDEHPAIGAYLASLETTTPEGEQ